MRNTTQSTDVLFEWKRRNGELYSAWSNGEKQKHFWITIASKSSLKPLDQKDFKISNASNSVRSNRGSKVLSNDY
jgi:hypothetical protein